MFLVHAFFFHKEKYVDVVCQRNKLLHEAS